MQNYREFVDLLTEAVHQAKQLPLGTATPCSCPEIPEDASRALVVSPHPDDECVIGTLPLRLLRQNRMRIINVAVTQGSRKDRQAARFEELQQACRHLGFGLVQTRPGGLEHIKLETRRNKPEQWQDSVKVMAKILAEISPEIIFFPHADDWNSTHIGTHWLTIDALSMMPKEFSCTVIETEYWQPMTDPNIMVETEPAVLADLITALTFHKGEVARNPYHLALPAWMQDNVRRGGELVGGQGEAAPDFTFATLYRVSRWHNGNSAKISPKTKILPSHKFFNFA